MSDVRLLLASSSPRRTALLREFGYAFDVTVPDVEEISDPGMEPAALVRQNALLKGRAVARSHPDRIIVAADTVVAFQGRVFGKPADMEEARTMLRELNGRAHQVLSGLCLIDGKRALESCTVDTTLVQFRELSEEARTRYLERIHPLDKAGAYAAQDDCGEIIASVSGSLTNVIGLPMELLKRELHSLLSSNETPRADITSTPS